MDIAGLSGFTFPSINKNSLKTWYTQFDHLGWQTIIWFAKKMANGIDLSKVLPHSVCKPCSISNL